MTTAHDEAHCHVLHQHAFGVHAQPEVLRRTAAGTISIDQQSEILQIVDNAEPALFRPLLYVIPVAIVETKIRSVPLADKAHPLSEEYIIDALQRPEFDVVEFPRS